MTAAHGYRLRAARGDVDMWRFEFQVADGRRALDAGDDAVASTRLSHALRLWHGPALADFADEAFAQDPISRLDGLRLGALEDRADADLRLGRHAEIIGELQSLVAANPLREGLREQAMLALYRCGRQADALESVPAGVAPDGRARPRARAGPGRAQGEDPRPQPGAQRPESPSRRSRRTSAPAR